jgi:ABC-type branched-subunit amino acid transport system substrate-binding protein
MKNGVAIAVKQVNDKGGIKGRLMGAYLGHGEAAE